MDILWNIFFIRFYTSLLDTLNIIYVRKLVGFEAQLAYNDDHIRTSRVFSSLSAPHLYQWSLLRSTGRGQDLRALFRNMQLCSNSHYSVSACRQHHTHIVRQSDNDLVSFGITKPAAALPSYTYGHQADNLLFSKLYRKTVLPPTR